MSDDPQEADELTVELVKKFYFTVSDHYQFVSNYVWDSMYAKGIDDVKDVDHALTGLERHMEMIEPANWSLNYLYDGLKKVANELDLILSNCPN
jgi:hypothetical protein